MTKNKKIGIVTTHSFGYIDFLINKLKENNHVDLVSIDIDKIPFKYKNVFNRIGNVFTKLMYGYGLKDKNRTETICKLFAKDEPFDQILIIRPDKLQEATLHYLRGITNELNCFLFDGIENFGQQKKVLNFFDTVFSYDPRDVAKYKFTFMPNFIYDDIIVNKVIEQKVFNVSSFDKRIVLIQKIANQLYEKNISFRLIVKKSKISKYNHIEIINKYKTLAEVKDLISKSEVLIDIQKENQFGLSFRVFEALGYQKKLITNNQDIETYDFYNTDNIYILRNNNFDIPQSFFNEDYTPVNEEVLKKYKLENWIKTVFKV